MALNPLSTSLIKLFKVKASAVGDVEKWEACIRSQLLAGQPLNTWLKDVYALFIILQQHRWATVLCFDPEGQFFKFMQEWLAQVMFLQRRDAARQALQALPFPVKRDTSEEDRAASRVLAFLGIECDVSHDDLLPMSDSDDEVSSGSGILMSMSSDSSATSSANSTPEPMNKTPLPFPEVMLDLPMDSLAFQMLTHLNLKNSCGKDLRFLEVNLQFRIRARKIDLAGIIARVRSFCRTNAGEKGFYDEQGCLPSMIQCWHEAQLHANLNKK